VMSHPSGREDLRGIACGLAINNRGRKSVIVTGGDSRETFRYDMNVMNISLFKSLCIELVV